MSCKKTEIAKVCGCTDINSPIYNPLAEEEDSSCLYIYAIEFEVISFPLTDANGSNWDIVPGTTNPDLLLTIRKEGETNNTFTSSVLNNQDSSNKVIWTAPIPFAMLNENWIWELNDSDGLSNNDFMAQGIFNPLNAFNSSSSQLDLISSNGETSIILYFTLNPE